MLLSWLFVLLNSAPALAADKPPAPAAIAGDETDHDDAAATDDEATDDDDDGADGDGEAETGDAASQPTVEGLVYSGDLDDPALEKSFVEDLASLGSISVGFADAGRVINAVQLAKGDAWEVVLPTYAWGTLETIDALTAAAEAVRAEFPSAPPLRVNHIGKKEGGYLRPHKSHQSGRDADLGFYYKNGANPGALRGQRHQLIDLAQNWVLLRSLITEADVQVILVDRRIQKVLFDYALSIGEDREWLDRIFHDGARAVVQHARRHRDHFHVRFYSPRSQELGRRVQPLLAKRPDENLVVHRIKNGDSLGHLARRYNSSVGMIQKANRLRGTFLRVGRTLSVPLRGPCTDCPLPPPVVVPPRRLPPKTASVERSTTTASVDK